MILTFKCEDKHETDYITSMSEDYPKEIPCDICGKSSYRVWGSNIIIPDYMRAVPQDGSAGTFAEPSNLQRHFAHASRPSGRGKTLY